MPHFAARRANRLLDRMDDGSIDFVKDSLAQATSLVDAAQRGGLFEDDSDGSALATFEALPAVVSDTILAVLRSATDKDLPVSVQWKPGTQTTVEVWEVTDAGAEQVGVLLTAPLVKG